MEDAALSYIRKNYRCSNWKNPPLEKTLPFTGAQSVCLEISNLEGVHRKMVITRMYLRVRCMSLT